jgi:hypothetical protein
MMEVFVVHLCFCSLAINAIVLSEGESTEPQFAAIFWRLL